VKLLSRPSAAAIALVASVLLALFSPGCSSRGEPRTGTTATSDTIICGFYPAVSSTGEAIERPEYYLLSAMNRKLKQFPDFAAAAGMNSVSDCPGARNVYRAYASFSRSHPRFDENLPLPKLPRLHDLVPKVPGVATVSKLFNGTPSSFFPAVFLFYRVPAGVRFFDHSVDSNGHGPSGTDFCTGAFIAKNWILTAAHCLSNIALQEGTNGDPSHWLTAYQWLIVWPDANGTVITSDPDGGNVVVNPGSMQLRTYLVSIVDQNFIGVTNPTGAPAATLLDNNSLQPLHDVALLYVDAENNDGHLPPMSTQPDGTPSFLAVSSVPPEPIWTLTAYGYGPPASNAIPSLTSGDISDSFQLTGTTPAGFTLDDLLIGETIPNGGFSFASLCEGDSGGPLIHDFGGGSLGIVGIASGLFAQHNCANQGARTAADGAPVPNEEAVWARADAEVSFIQQTLQDTYGSNFQCPPGPAGPGKTNNLFIQCQGPSCQSDCDCDSKSFCSNPAALDPSSVFQTGEDTCSVCSDGTCNCLQGQCLPRPVDFEGGDMNSDASSCDGP
jgi:hypothetical protein